MPKATNLGRMVTYLEQLIHIKPHDHIITWSCRILWQSKTIIYPLPHCLWLQRKLCWVGICNEELPSIKSQGPLIMLSCKVTWQIKYISNTARSLWPLLVERWWLTMACYKFTEPFKHVVFCDHVKNWKCLISISTISRATKVSSVVI